MCHPFPSCRLFFFLFFSPLVPPPLVKLYCCCLLVYSTLLCRPGGETPPPPPPSYHGFTATKYLCTYQYTSRQETCREDEGVFIYQYIYLYLYLCFYIIPPVIIILSTVGMQVGYIYMHGHPRYIHTCLCDGENKKKKKKRGGRSEKKITYIPVCMYVCM